MEVAKRVGLRMVAVPLPAHLMIRVDSEDMEVLVDAFNGGEVGRLVGWMIGWFVG